MDDYCWSVRYFLFYFEQMLLTLTFAEKLVDTVQHVWVRFKNGLDFLISLTQILVTYILMEYIKVSIPNYFTSMNTTIDE